jgi:tetratricopeptide (TPR) repeat protein
MDDPSRLDAEELLHLALEASRRNGHAEAIEYLKRAVALVPRDAKVAYFLGAEHAQIGLYDRAIEDISRAVEIDPQLHAAHFQLGLLYLLQGRVENAINAWRPLDRLGEGDALFHFKTGLEHLARDEFPGCRAHLERGLALNRSNSALNTDMQRVLDELSARVQAAGGQPGIQEPRPAGHVFLSAYGKTQH